MCYCGAITNSLAARTGFGSTWKTGLPGGRLGLRSRPDNINLAGEENGKLAPSDLLSFAETEAAR